MTKETLEGLRVRLTEMADRVQENAESLEEQARVGLGGDAGGNLSNAPMHLGDLGTAVYQQELTTALLENEQYIRDEVREALGRMDRGDFGVCENCRAEIPEERLDALPYTRYCTPCAAELGAGKAVNLNDGRPARLGAAGDPGDVHAAGTAGGGTAVGGLAGTNVGTGDPDAADLEGATGSGRFDAAADADADDPAGGYAGPSGGAVGGTPANKRVTGGKSSGP